MLCFNEDAISGLLKEYPDPREGEAGTVSLRREKELRAALPCFAVVTDNRDPEGLGRVRVACGALAPGVVSEWIPFAGRGRGGDGSGVWSLPDTGTQALLVFPENGVHSPVALGCVFDEKRLPPSSEGAFFVWQTKNHRFEIKASDGGEVLVIGSARGQIRYTAGAAGIRIVNELGDIDIVCGRLKIGAAAGLSFSAKEKLSVRAGGGIRGKSAKASVFTGGGRTSLKGKTIKLSASRGVKACGRPLAKKGDAVMGFDIHKTEIPSGSGTSTALLPHPFIGKLSKGLSPDVTLAGAACAVLGSIAVHNDGGHNRLPGTVRFTQNPKNEGKVSGAAAETVKVNGRKAALAGSTVSTCSDTGQKDNSTVMAAGAAFPMPAIINPANTDEYMFSRAAGTKIFPAFTAVNWNTVSADEGHGVHLRAQVKDIADGNAVTFQIWREADDPAAHTPVAVIPAELKNAAASAVWSWSLPGGGLPPPDDPRFFFTAHSAWCAPEKSPLLTLRLSRPRLEQPEWTDADGKPVTRALAGEPLYLSVHCEGMEDGAPVLFRVHSVSGGAALAEIPSEVSGGKAAAEWIWRLRPGHEPLTEKPRLGFTAVSPRCADAASSGLEISARVAFWLLSADGMLIPRAEGSLFREGESRDIEISGGFYEDPACVPGNWSLRLGSITYNDGGPPEEFEKGEKAITLLEASPRRLAEQGVLLDAGGKELVICLTGEKGYSL